MVVRVGGFQDPPLDLLAPAPLGDLVFCGDLFGVIEIAALIYHPGAGPVFFPHAGGDLVLVLAAVHQHQGHAIGPAPGLVHGGKAVMGQHGGGAFAGQRPVGVQGAELVNVLCLVAAVHQGQVDHDLFAVRHGQLGIHNPFHLAHGKGLPVGNILAGHIIAPGPDRPVQAILLYVDPAGHQFGPWRQRPFRCFRLALHYHVGVGFQLGVLPGFGQPAIGEIVQQFRVVF